MPAMGITPSQRRLIKNPAAECPVGEGSSDETEAGRKRGSGERADEIKGGADAKKGG
jgi:hypothetical protein